MTLINTASGVPWIGSQLICDENEKRFLTNFKNYIASSEQQFQTIIKMLPI